MTDSRTTKKTTRQSLRRLDQEEVAVDRLVEFRRTDPALAWMQVLAALTLARVAHAAVKLGIVEALQRGRKTLREVARVTSTDAAALRRLLRALAAAGIVIESPGERFRLAPAGTRLLHRGTPSFARALLDFFEPELVPLDGLVRTLRTGRPAFEEKHGIAFYDYLERQARGGARFDASMNIGSLLRSQALLAGVDFTRFRSVIDVGGGDGTLLSMVLRAHPHLRGGPLERPDTAARARAHLERRGDAGRIDVVAGDFFAGVPSGGDVYVLSFVLHNWDDRNSVALLSACRRAMNPDGLVAIVDQIRVPTAAASIVEYLSLPMLELMAGSERTEREFRAMLRSAGLRMTGIVGVADNPFSLIEARARRTATRRTTALTRKRRWNRRR